MEKRKKGHIKTRISGKRNDHGEYKPGGVEKDEMLFGTRAVIEAINAGKEIERLFIQKDLSNDLTRQLLQLARDHSLPVTRVPLQKLNSITRKNHQGVVCFLSAIRYASLDHIVTSCFEQGRSPFLVMLDRITDVRNFGAIARTAECGGVDAIIIPGKGGAQITGDAMKTSAGALNFIPVCREDNLKDTIRYLQDSGISVIACTEKATNYLYEQDLKQPLTLLMGSEENGVSPEYLKRASGQAKIPIKGSIGSLNVSVATAVAVFEAVRQRDLS